MNYWIGGSNAELREALRHVDILTINDDETRQLTGEHNLLRAAKHIFKMGPTTLIIKRGEHGAIMVHKKFLFSVPAFPLEEVFDPTGAGDSFAGGFMVYLAGAGNTNEQTLRRAMVYGSVMGSFTVERFGCGAPGQSEAVGDQRPRSSIREADVVQALESFQRAMRAKPCCTI